MAVFTKIILVCLLSFQGHSFASGPVFEADTFGRRQRERKAVYIHSLTQRDGPCPCGTPTLPVASGERL